MELSTETRERVFTAADALFEQAGRTGFPTVESVRKTAGVKMRDASAGMREWRRLQTAQATSTVIHVPEVVQTALNSAAIVLWRHAQEQAAEALRAAQVRWETEREELNAMHQELADAFEEQDVELNTAVAMLAAKKTDLETAVQELAATRQEVKDTINRAEKAEVRNVEIERRGEELRAERDRALEVAAKAREDAATLRGRLEALEASKNR